MTDDLRPIVGPRGLRVIRAPAIAAVLLVLATGVGTAQPLPRVEHVSRALAAVRGLGPAGRDRLDRELYAAARAQCRADTAMPAVTCLIAAARRVCATETAEAAETDRARCEAAADVVVTNLRASKAMVDEATRLRLARGSTDYRAALAAQLRRRYAILAAELVLRGASPAREAAAIDPLASQIDELCAHRDREIHACAPGDTACVASLSWSRCVAALVWFIGGSP
jgi:hypothetical protein